MSEKTALDFAEQILVRVKESRDDGITNLKLQKLLYYILGWTLAIEKRLLFKDPVEAQPFGPAFPSVWEKYRSAESGGLRCCSAVRIEHNPLIDAALNVYGAQKAHVLVARTHREQPWMDNYCEDNPDVSAIIPTKDIERYFSAQLVGSDVRLHTAFLGAYIDRKFEAVSIKSAPMSREEIDTVRAEIGLV